MTSNKKGEIGSFPKNLLINKYGTTVVERFVYYSCLSCFTQNIIKLARKLFYNVRVHSCSDIKIVCLFRLTCEVSQALTWSWSSSWPSWIGTSWKDVTGVQEGQMPSQLVPPRSQAMLTNSRHYIKDSLSLFHTHPCSQGSRAAVNLENIATII